MKMGKREWIAVLLVVLAGILIGQWLISRHDRRNEVEVIPVPNVTIVSTPRTTTTTPRTTTTETSRQTTTTSGGCVSCGGVATRRISGWDYCQSCYTRARNSMRSVENSRRGSSQWGNEWNECCDDW